RVSASDEWPRRPNNLGNKLRRLAPNLRKAGLSVEFVHTGCERRIKLFDIARQMMRKTSLASLASLGSDRNGSSNNDLRTNDPAATANGANDDPDDVLTMSRGKVLHRKTNKDKG